MDLFKIFYLIIYIYPFQNSYIIAIELSDGQNLCSCESLHCFYLLTSTDLIF